MFKSWFKKKEVEPLIALPPDFAFVRKVIKAQVDASLEKETKTLQAFQVWLSNFVRQQIEKSLKGSTISWISFSTEMKKDGYGTEYGTIFRMFYEQGDNTKLSFSQGLLNKMKEWILGDFSSMYTTAGYRVIVSENRLEISWMHIEKRQNES